MDELLKRHAKEKEFVENQIRQLSKPKLGRKPLTAAELAEKADQLRTELVARHSAELEQIKNLPEEPNPLLPEHQSVAAVSDQQLSETGAAQHGNTGTPTHDAEQGDEAPETSGSKLTRKQRRQAAQAARDAQQAAEDVHTGPRVDLRAEEISALNGQLASLALAVHAVPADGNCLFYAVQDQLVGLTGNQSASKDSMSMSSLRKRAADYIVSHWPDFAPFLPYEVGDGYDGTDGPQARAAVDKYCKRLESTAAWGGHPELRALSCTLGLPIIVYQKDGEPLLFQPDGREDGAGRGKGPAAALRLTFHRHYLTTGEHYNSVRPAASSTVR